MRLHCPRRYPASASGRSRAARRLASFLLSGLGFAVTPTVAVLAQDVRLAVSPVSDPAAAHVAEAALRFGIPEPWIRAVLQVESGGNRTAVSSAGAMGLMQIMPETWAELRIQHRLGEDPFEPRDNILAGAAYLREMFDRYGNIGAMLAAYNAGPARYDEYLGYDEYLAGTRELPAETRAYVATLAPLLGGDPLLSGALAAALPPADWREASLFVARFDGTATGPDSHPERGADSTVAAPAVPAHPHALAPSGELLVARSRPEDAP
ncbi:lytic transglycosylase domain-containing protein [Rhodobacter sp. SGA-6-6]|uniref:lytic transglycosylase domain-containing protein n=1 Tax=Rhodobacter sp. SGA-6-6 TaxID=2710882 RepID=UPI00197D31D4|nr:lytic transglycosylase domain-containing protein [Rhodobacter sp. SGA-6-6]